MTVPRLVWTQQTRSKRPFWCLTAPEGDTEFSIIPRINTTTGELKYTVYFGKPGQRGKQKLAHVAQLERAKTLAEDSAFARRVLYLIVDAGDDHGMTAAEVAAATGASIEEAKDMMRRLQDGGYLRNATRRAVRAAPSKPSWNNLKASVCFTTAANGATARSPTYCGTGSRNRPKHKRRCASIYKPSRAPLMLSPQSRAY
jgi:hypothetical protein